MEFFFANPFEKKQKNEQNEQAVVAVDESFYNITEGGEFLDDAIRTKEQPFQYPHTEESITPGSVEGLL